MVTNDSVLSAGAWHSKVWRLSWPIVLANLTIPMVGAVDTAVMGRLPDAAYIGAVAVGATLFSAMYWIFGFLRMGTTGLTAQAMGARDYGELAAIALRAGAIALVLGLVIVALQWPLQHGLLALFSASDHVEDLAGRYYGIRVWGAPATLLYFVQLGVLFGTQQMRATLWLSLTLNLTNVALDLLFVVGFGWGVEGVALGTALSEWLVALVGLPVTYQALRSRAKRLQLPPHQVLWNPARVQALFSVSINLIVRTFFVQLPFFTFTLLGASLGNEVLAANAVLMQFFFVLIFAMDAFAHTAETLTGHAFGANDRRQFRSAAWYTTFWASVTAVVGSVIFFAFGSELVALLSTSPDVQNTAAEYLGWLVVAPLVSCWAFQLDGIFIGTTQTVTLRNSMFASALVFVATLWLTFERWDNHAIWLAMMAFMVARTLILGRHYPLLEAQVEWSH